MLIRSIKMLISAFYFVLDKTIHLLQSLLCIRTPDTLVVLSYHSVKPRQRQRFANQMDQVVKLGKPVFADMPRGSGQGIHHIAVTFDDGYKSFMDNALPEMLVRRIPAILFIPTQYLGQLPGWINTPGAENSQEILISEIQLKCLPADMVKIGSHCVTHSRLTLLRNEEIVRELSDSKSRLEQVLQRNIETLSFPYDDYNNEIVELARKAGYLRVFKDLPTYPTSNMDGFLLGRISVSPDDWRIEYLLKLKGSYQWLPFAVLIKRSFIKIFSRHRPA